MLKKSLLYSIIIPVYNGENYIYRCIDSILKQDNDKFNIEILIIDDCSTDKTSTIVEKLASKYRQIKLLTTSKNSGPGVARNIGIDRATGDWLIFVDSDDMLSNDALNKLYTVIDSSKELDIIGYDFCYDKESEIRLDRSGRVDISSLYKNKKELILDYLSLYMDGSVIYTCISTKLVKKNSIKFYSGLHEDVDFIFKVYFHANNIRVIEDPIYIKNNRKDSIVNTISFEHFEGIFRAYHEIYTYLDNNNLVDNEILSAYYTGIIGLCATRVRDINLKKPEDAKELYLSLYENIFYILRKFVANSIKKPKLNTKYYMIYDFFITTIKENDSNLVKSIENFMDNINSKSWSCYDLQHSLFLAPDEIRTCCKRFFIDSQIKGDVSILNGSKYKYRDFNVNNILKEKRDLYTNINKGVANECNGCPFLEFKEWDGFDDLNIQYISFEYHSICNMKCIYCSDTYYGGKMNSYDILVLVKELVNKNKLRECNTVVWGGGEPTIDKNFLQLLEKMVINFPNIKQRLITNSTLFLDDVKKYIDEDKVSIVTSIDAGSKELFLKIRKNKHFEKVFKNLGKYGSKKPENITIKYIVLDENRKLGDMLKFIQLIKKYKLQGCNFQISFDFKKEFVDFDSSISIVILYGLLIKLNVRLVFFDDLLRDRFENISKEYNKIYSRLKELGYSDILADRQKLKNIVIWGAGNQTKRLLETSNFFKYTNILYLVDNTTSKIGTKLLGYDIYDPKILKNSEYPVLIVASQNSSKILDQYKDLGLDESKIIKGLVI